MVRITPTSAPVGAYVSDLDPRAISRAEAAELYRAFLDYGVLVFAGMEVDVAGQMALASLFGVPDDPHPMESLRHPEAPSLTVLTGNGGAPVPADDPDADRIIGAIPWHADRMYTPRPNRGALLCAKVIATEGGNTGWIDTARLYRSLPTRIKSRIQGLRIVHSYETSHKKQSMVGGSSDFLPDTNHPLVFVHPESDVPVLNIAPATAKELIGLPADEGAELLDWLIEFATREDEAYVHRWKPGDVVAWDNWRAIHRAYGHAKRYPRVMHSLALKSEMTLGVLVPRTGSFQRAVA